MRLCAAPEIEPSHCGDYVQAVGAAREMGAEKSWAQAREWYRAALALAPDAGRLSPAVMICPGGGYGILAWNE